MIFRSAIPLNNSPPTSSGRTFLKKFLPWVAAFAIMAVLFLWIPFDTLYQCLSGGPWFKLGLYIVLQVLAALFLDAFATNVSLAMTGIKQEMGETLLVRGATYLVGILNYVLGQGGLGLYLHRAGVGVARVTGIFLFMVIVNMMVMLLVASLGLLLGGLSSIASEALSLTVYLLIATTVAYLLIIAVRPRLLREYQILAPLFAAGMRGHLIAALGRLPHVLLLVLAYWGALRLWGVRLPFSQGIILVPTFFLVAALPVTPTGLGLTQTAQVLLFSAYADYPTADARAAALLAFSLVYYFFGLAAQGLLGLLCLHRLQKRNSCKYKDY